MPLHIYSPISLLENPVIEVITMIWSLRYVTTVTNHCPLVTASVNQEPTGIRMHHLQLEPPLIQFVNDLQVVNSFSIVHSSEHPQQQSMIVNTLH